MAYRILLLIILLGVITNNTIRSIRKMPILADLSRRLHFLTTDAKPDPPRFGVQGFTNNLPPSADEPTQKSLPTTPEVNKNGEAPGGTFKRQQSMPEPSAGESESSRLGNGSSSNCGSRKNSKETKNPRFKTKVPIRNATAQTANIVNYNIINSNGVKIGATKTYVCNVNQCTKNSRESCDSGTSRGKTRVMTKAVEDLSMSKREITIDDIFLIKTHIGHGWRDVIRRLGYSEGQLDQFEENHKGKGIDEVIYQAFLDWKQANTKDAQIGILITQMWSCREYDCAQRLAAAATHETPT